MNEDKLKNALDDIQIIALKELNQNNAPSDWNHATAERFAKALADIEALTRNVTK